jgi:hypothetical protein
MAWIKNNIIQILTIIVVVTFGYANFTADIKANANSIDEQKVRVDRLEEKIDKGLKLLERIDERTKRL